MKKSAIAAVMSAAMLFASSGNIAQAQGQRDDWIYSNICTDDQLASIRDLQWDAYNKKKNSDSSGDDSAPPGQEDWLTDGTEANKTAQAIYDYLTQEIGTSGAFAAGVLANVRSESGFVKDRAEGPGMLRFGERGVAMPPGGGPGGGLYQFTPHTKYVASPYFAESGWSVEGQTQYVWDTEFKTHAVMMYVASQNPSYGAAHYGKPPIFNSVAHIVPLSKDDPSKFKVLLSKDAFVTTDDPVKASTAFQVGYERPAMYHVEREDAARQANAKFNKDNYRGDASKLKKAFGEVGAVGAAANVLGEAAGLYSKVKGFDDKRVFAILGDDGCIDPDTGERITPDNIGAFAGGKGGDSRACANGLTYPTTGRFTSNYGRSGTDPSHVGLDIAGKPHPGSNDVYAIMDGTVTEAGPAAGYGQWIRIKHEGEIWSEYGHFFPQDIKVKVGDEVKAGQVIGKQGYNGGVDPPGPGGTHLHINIEPNGQPIDPEPWFRSNGLSDFPKLHGEITKEMADKGCTGGGGGGGKGTKSGNKIVDAARSQIGVPYSWGGGGKNGKSKGIPPDANLVGFDCSGLAQYAVYKGSGVDIGGSTSEQLAWASSKGTMKKVSKEDAKPGDLIYTPGHVAIYAGNGKMIEAPDRGQKVQEASVRWGDVYRVVKK